MGTCSGWVCPGDGIWNTQECTIWTPAGWGERMGMRKDPPIGGWSRGNLRKDAGWALRPVSHYNINDFTQWCWPWLWWFCYIDATRCARWTSCPCHWLNTLKATGGPELLLGSRDMSYWCILGGYIDAAGCFYRETRGPECFCHCQGNFPTSSPPSASLQQAALSATIWAQPEQNAKWRQRKCRRSSMVIACVKLAA